MEYLRKNPTAKKIEIPLSDSSAAKLFETATAIPAFDNHEYEMIEYDAENAHLSIDNTWLNSFSLRISEWPQLGIEVTKQDDSRRPTELTVTEQASASSEPQRIAKLYGDFTPDRKVFVIELILPIRKFSRRAARFLDSLRVKVEGSENLSQTLPSDFEGGSRAEKKKATKMGGGRRRTRRRRSTRGRTKRTRTK